MSLLTITVGLPGSGKTTWAKAEAGRTGAARLNRDGLREIMFGGYTGRREHEDAVTKVQFAGIAALLDAGQDLIVDDTNMRAEHRGRFLRLSYEASCRVVVQDFTDVPIETCIERDAARTVGQVGEQVIRNMWAKYLAEME